MLCHTGAESITITCISHQSFIPPKKFDISDLQKKNDLIHRCVGSRKVTLEGESTLPFDGVTDIVLFLDWLLMTKEIEMCVLIENYDTVYKLIISQDYIIGTCKGPSFSIVNNTNLELIDIRNKKFGKNMASVAIRVRGNKKLDADDLRKFKKLREKVNGNWDLQPLGECTLPKPFISFEMLDQTCTDFYGPLVIQEGITKIEYDSSKVHKFNLEGCIQIQRTELKDVSFLMAFSRFRRMQYCSQFIRDNKRLCTRNLKYLNVFFKDIQLSNNTDQTCGECIGGIVSEHYLRESVNCSTVYGDLIIANFRGLPLNFENLRGIEVIEGRLVIINNTGLHKFDYFTSLKKVGRSTDNVAIIIKNNGDLKILEIPSVLNIQFKREDERIEMENNPMLFRDSEQKSALSTTVEKRSTSGKMYDGSSTAPENSKVTGSLANVNLLHHIGKNKSKMVYGVIAAAASFMLLCSTATFFVCRQKAPVISLWQSRCTPQANTEKKTANRSVLQSTSASSGVSSSSKTTSTSSTAEQARRSSTTSCLQHK